MRETTLRIDVPGSTTVTAMRTAPKSAGAWTFIYAPGAGSNVQDPFGVHACGRLSERGVACVRFQFPYQEAGRSGPDRPPVLEATWRAGIDAARGEAGKLCIGGRSMGGRIGSMVHAAGVKVDALALFAYPLHPPGKPEKMRTEHFRDITARTLFVSGTNDAFASPEELRDAAELLKRSSIHMLAGADHGFAVKKSSGRDRAAVYDEAVDALIKWLKID